MQLLYNDIELKGDNSSLYTYIW